jgi:hypothetical protein
VITKEDVNKIVHALQNSDLRDGIAVCFVLVDTEDGSVATCAPDGVNKQLVLQVGLEHQEKSEAIEQWDVHPRGDPS